MSQMVAAHTHGSHAWTALWLNEAYISTNQIRIQIKMGAKFDTVLNT